MERLGVGFSGGLQPREVVECIQLADELGYESAWVSEGHGGDQFSVLTACALKTENILLGTSISSVFRAQPSHHRHGCRLRGPLLPGEIPAGLGDQPQGPGRAGARLAVRPGSASLEGMYRYSPDLAKGWGSLLPRRNIQHRAIRSVV